MGALVLRSSTNGEAEGNLATLNAVFRGCGYTFRHVPDTKVAMMKWQAGRIACDVIDLPGGYGEVVERFELLAWAPTASQLIDQLAGRD